MSVPATHFEALYATDPDPWRYATSEYEQAKYAATLAALPRPQFRRGLEVGCSIGILTARLAERCGTLLAIDGAGPALGHARRNCPLPHVTFERRLVPGEWPDGRYDLIVFSEVLYYLDPADLHATAALARGALDPAGAIVLVNYLGPTDAPHGGEAAAAGFIAAACLPACAAARTGSYRIDLLQAPP